MTTKSRQSKEIQSLTPQQELFCREYLIDLNGTQAAIRAGYSAKTAAEQASRLLTNVRISERLSSLMKKQFERVELTAETILSELLLLAKADLSKAFDEQGKLLPVKQMPEEVRRAIASVEVFEELAHEGRTKKHIGDTIRLKFWDKTKALELLGKHLKLFTEKVEHSGKISLEELVVGSSLSKEEGET